MRDEEIYTPYPHEEGRAQWRKVQPTNLRFRDTELSPASHRYSIFSGSYYEPSVKRSELEEQWERVHKGEIVETEWRKVYHY